MQALPNILILGTGGTIAGSASDETIMEHYQAGVISAATLMAKIPLAQFAQIQVETIAQINSKDLQFSLWVDLAKRISMAQQDDVIDGVVVLHGTDTLEETAYFLQLSVTLAKPLVLVGALRPMTALSADGPLNLLHAVRVAGDKNTFTTVPLVVMNQQIFSAQEVTKAYAYSVGAFVAPEQGALGHIFDTGIRWLRAPVVVPLPAFLVDDSRPWPWVEILTHCAGAQARVIDTLVDAGVRGLILEGTGAGTFSEVWLAAISRARRKGVLCVRTSRCWTGPVLEDLGCDDTGLEVLPAGDLTPQKARILLLLALRCGYTYPDLAKLFQAYQWPLISVSA